MRRSEIPEALRGLILDALRVQYISESCQDAIRTGNHYQSLTLGASTTEGFRSERVEFLDRIDFSGKKVLDLGSNLGEMSRGARARGARLVDGFEYDPYFVEIADLVNVLNGVKGVSFYRRDITDPSIYGERYDLVLVLSVFIYASKVVDRLAEITDVLVLETHKLRGNLHETYIDPLSPHFPVYEVLGESEWGMPHEQGERAVLVFAKDERALRSTLLETPRRPEQPTPSAPSRETSELEIDVPHSGLYRAFHECFGRSTPEETLSAVAAHDLGEAPERTADARRAYGGWTYWLLFARGYLAFRAAGRVEPDNPYLDYMRRFVGPEGHDPSLVALLEDDEEATTLLARRFRDLAYYESRARGEEIDYAPAPVRLVLSDPPRRNQPTLRTTSGERLSPRQVDGWHRLFGASLFGIERVPAEAVRADARIGAVLAEIEHFSYDGAVVEVRGWCLSPDTPVHMAQLTANDSRVANVELEDRPDVGARFPHVAHSLLAGFSVRAVSEHDAREPIDFTLTLMEDWLPVGRLELPQRPWMRTESGPSPAGGDAPAKSEPNHGTSVLRAARIVERVASHLEERTDPSAFTAVLDWGPDAALRGAMLAERTGAPSVTERELVRRTAASGPPAVLDGARSGLTLPDLPAESFDLVLACSVAAGLDRAEQRLWLSELYRLARPGGWVAVSTQGELLRRFLPERAARRLKRDGIASWGATTGLGWHPPGTFVQTREHTESVCSELFEIVEYGVGEIDDLEDLVLLRRPG